MSRWRYLLSPPADGRENMALDEALMCRAASTGEAVLRVYTWSRPTLSVGRHQATRGAYDAAILAASGVDLVRRPTGGRAILHDREVTYSVTMPTAEVGSLQESYQRINRLLVVGLRALGVPVDVAPATLVPALDLTPCFERPSAGELVAAGRKLVGSAQWREHNVLLQHGSILVDGDQSRVSSLLRRPTPPPPRPATLRECLGYAPTADDVGAALVAGVRSCEDADASPLSFDESLRHAVDVRRRRYEDAQWTWRR